jgi:hypothetical protein
MLESAKEAVKFAAGNSRKDLDEDRKLLLAIIKSIEIIGDSGIARSGLILALTTCCLLFYHAV